jgi:hypothetical protein
MTRSLGDDHAAAVSLASGKKRGPVDRFATHGADHDKFPSLDLRLNFFSLFFGLYLLRADNIESHHANFWLPTTDKFITESAQRHGLDYRITTDCYEASHGAME